MYVTGLCQDTQHSVGFFVLLSMKKLITLFLVLIFFSTNAQVKNLVLEGGGVRGIAYIGAIQVMEQESLLDSIENIAGTSVGAISAGLLACGYSAEELKTEITQMNIRKFNDGKGIFIGGSHRMMKQFGWYRGNKLEKWIDKLIESKTGVKALTFAQLHDLALKDKQFKNLFVTATNLSKQNSMTLSHKNFPNMPVSTAIRISASIPLYFRAVFLNDAGEVVRKPKKGQKVEVLVDGGFISNYPIHVFDDTYEKNATVGLRLEREEQIALDTVCSNQLADYEIINFRDYVGAFYNLIIENLNRSEMTDDDWIRTISISTCGVGPKIKKMPEEDIEMLINAGKIAVEHYFKIN